LAKSLALVVLAHGAMAATGCGDDVIETRPRPDAGSADAGQGDAGRAFPDSGIGFSELTVQRIVPDHGPFMGGTVAVIRGAGFTADAEVTIGGRLVQPADTTLIDDRRLRVIVPAGEVGPADVLVRVGEDEIILPDGYTYDAISVDPGRGSISGGTLVNIVGSGTLFEDGDTVTFGRLGCDDLTVVSETRLTCRTPPGSAGTVDVTVVRAADGTEITAPDAFTYYDSTDPISGGLGGGPLMGTMNVTVLNGATGDPLPDAFVMVDEDISTLHQGLTDLRGQVSFSGDDLIGRHTVHAAKHCFEKTSFVTFDASDVTIFLIPWMDPMCGEGGEPPVGRPRQGTFINGELIWRGPNEYGPNPWTNIPPPRANEIKVAYVFTTQASLTQPNPDPAIGGLQRVLEILPPDDEEHLGYPYRIFARPAGLAVYALAGLENTTTGEFIPYIMGIARNVLGGPGEEVRGADMVMNIPLDHTVDVRLSGLPAETARGPNRFKTEAYIDLGGEGLIVRQVNLESLDIVRSRTSANPFRFWGQPALYDALSDGRYRFIAGWYTGDFDAQPYSVVVRQGVRDVAAETVLDGFVGIPRAMSPELGARIPADRILRWEANGGVQPDFHIVLMIGGDGNPAWRHFAPGDVTEAPIPDLSSIPDIDDISGGFITWVVYAVRVPGVRFDEFTYDYLADRYWEAYALDYFTAQR
jgi:hypothetical protein